MWIFYHGFYPCSVSNKTKANLRQNFLNKKIKNKNGPPDSCLSWVVPLTLDYIYTGYSQHQHQHLLIKPSIVGLSLFPELLQSIMALRKMLSKRLFDRCRQTLPSVTLQHSPLSTPSLKTLVPPNSANTNSHKEYLTSPDSTEKGFFRRFLHRRALDQSAIRLPEFLSIPVGEKLRDKLRGINIPGDRLRLEDLSPPAPDPAIGESLHGLSVDDARKILRLSQVEKLKAKLRDIPQSWIPYSDFSRICVEVCENEEQGVEFAKSLDASGNVIVLGNIVFLRPEQV